LVFGGLIVSSLSIGLFEGKEVGKEKGERKKGRKGPPPLLCSPLSHPLGFGQPRSQGSSLYLEKYPGCGWSRAYEYKSNPHRGWVFDLILSTLSMEVKVALPYRRYFEVKQICQRSCLTGASSLSEHL